MTLRLSSAAFGNSQSLPVRFTCDGANVSPPMKWIGLPLGTRSLSLIVADLTNPKKMFFHWGLYDIAPTAGGLEEHLDQGFFVNGMRQAINDLEEPAYAGPCPDASTGVHHFKFIMTALTVDKLPLTDGCDCRDVARLSNQFCLAQSQLAATYTGVDQSLSDWG